MSLTLPKEKIFRWLFKNPIYSGLILSIVVFSAVLTVVFSRINDSIRNRSKSLLEVGSVVKQNIDQYLAGAEMAATALSLAIDEDGRVKKFDSIANRIYQPTSYQCIQLAPKGVVRYIYPFESNQEVLGLDLLSKKTSNATVADAKKAIETKQMFYQGPTQLTQGGIGVVGRLPIFIKNKFWGFSAVVIKLDTLLTWSGLSNSNFKNYKFQLSRVGIDNQEKFFLPNIQKMYDRNYAVIRIPEGNWKLYIVGVSDWQVFMLNLNYILLGLLSSALSGFLFTRLIYSMAALSQQLEQQSMQVYSAEHKYKSIFESATVGIARIDSITGMFLEANQFLCSFFGYSERELLTKKIKSLIFEDDLPTDRNMFKQLLQGEINHFRSEARYLHKNGKIVWGKVTIKAMWEVKEVPDNHILILEDITITKNHEIRLTESREWVRRIINSVDGIVYESKVLNGDVHYTFVSEKITDILGYDAAVWLSTPNIQMQQMHPEDLDRMLTYREKSFNEEHHDLEYRISKANGDYVWIRNIFSRQISVNENKVTGIMLDITQRKKDEQALQQSYQLVSDQNERLLNFSHIVSHNLRSHASNIEGISVLIETAKNDEDRDEMIQLLKRVAYNLNDTLFNLNNIVNIQMSVDVIKEQINLNDFVIKTLATHNAQILGKKAAVINKVPKEINVIFNKAYLESVLLNLVSNALRYADPNRRPIITITCFEESEQLVLRISDNGIGIDMKKHGDKIFGLYQTFNGNSDARGFGLFITKNQVEAMGGRIVLESAPDQGSTFKIYFV